ncbi:MAG: hypothetical protein ACRD8A_12810 [Candidatus Acidiferrales bacterium]
MTRNNEDEAERAKEYGEALERERELLQERSAAMRLEFVALELDLAMTFCKSAASTSDPEKSGRNVAQAEKAYESAKHFLDGRRLRGPMRRTIQEKVSALESLLKKAREGKTER